MIDLIARLRKVDPDGGDDHSTRWYRNPDGPEAADRIERLEAALRVATDDKMALIDQLGQAKQDRMAQIDYGCDLHAALKAENAEQRDLLIQFANAFDAGYAAAERALAERAGGVRFVGNIPGSSSASGFAPLTTEPAAPEGQQEAVSLCSLHRLSNERIG